MSNPREPRLPGERERMQERGAGRGGLHGQAGVPLISVPKVMAWTPLLGTASYVPKWKCCGNHLNREGHPDEHYDGGGRFGKDSLPGARR